jgi:hypothetical protein
MRLAGTTLLACLAARITRTGGQQLETRIASAVHHPDWVMSAHSAFAMVGHGASAHKA